jgi:hypothetical protein
LGNNFFSHILSTLCLPFIKMGTWGSEWDLDTGDAFFTQPKDKRNYAVVISPEAHRKIHRSIDDAILRRGLHDSWERRFEASLIKCGFLGKSARKAYGDENRSRKMMVVDFEKKTFAHQLDGHAKASYCYLNAEKKLHNPKKKNAIGLAHRGPVEKKVFIEGKPQRCIQLSGNEAGEVARKSILTMVGHFKTSSVPNKPEKSLECSMGV